MDKKDMKQDKAMISAAIGKHEANMHKGKPKTKLAKGGSVSARADGCVQRGKTDCKMV